MFQFIQDLLLVNHGLVLMSGVKSPVMSYLWSTEAICGLEIAWDIRFNHIFYRCLKHDAPWMWRTICPLISPWLQKTLYLIPHPCARKDLYNQWNFCHSPQSPNLATHFFCLLQYIYYFCIVNEQYMLYRNKKYHALQHYYYHCCCCCCRCRCRYRYHDHDHDHDHDHYHYQYQYQYQ